MNPGLAKDVNLTLTQTSNTASSKSKKTNNNGTTTTTTGGTNPNNNSCKCHKFPSLPPPQQHRKRKRPPPTTHKSDTTPTTRTLVVAPLSKPIEDTTTISPSSSSPSLIDLAASSSIGTHRELVSSIFNIGMRESSPAAILEHMTDKSKAKYDGLNLERIKSKLQKYRKGKERNKHEFMELYDKSMASFCDVLPVEEPPVEDGISGCANGRDGRRHWDANYTQPYGLNHVGEGGGGSSPPQIHKAISSLSSGEAAAFLTHSIMLEHLHVKHNLEPLDFTSASLHNNSTLCKMGPDAAFPSYYENDNDNMLVLPPLTNEEKNSPLGRSIAAFEQFSQAIKKQLYNSRRGGTDTTNNGQSESDHKSNGEHVKLSAEIIGNTNPNPNNGAVVPQLQAGIEEQHKTNHHNRPTPYVPSPRLSSPHATSTTLSPAQTMVSPHSYCPTTTLSPQSRVGGASSCTTNNIPLAPPLPQHEMADLLQRKQQLEAKIDLMTSGGGNGGGQQQQPTIGSGTSLGDGYPQANNRIGGHSMTRVNPTAHHGPFQSSNNNNQQTYTTVVNTANHPPPHPPLQPNNQTTVLQTQQQRPGVFCHPQSQGILPNTPHHTETNSASHHQPQPQQQSQRVVQTSVVPYLGFGSGTLLPHSNNNNNNNNNTTLFHQGGCSMNPIGLPPPNRLGDGGQQLYQRSQELYHNQHQQEQEQNKNVEQSHPHLNHHF